jgi:hypothetical protein
MSRMTRVRNVVALHLSVTQMQLGGGSPEEVGRFLPAKRIPMP